MRTWLLFVGFLEVRKRFEEITNTSRRLAQSILDCAAQNEVEDEEDSQLGKLIKKIILPFFVNLSKIFFSNFNVFVNTINYFHFISAF